MNKLCIILSICAISMLGCVRKDEVIDINKVTDVQIMQARSYIADYDQRMEKVYLMIKSCSEIPDRDYYRDCRATAYDSVGLSYDIDKELSGRIKDEVTEYRKIALIPLSTE